MSALNTSLLLAQFAKHASTQITIFALHDFVGSIEEGGKMKIHYGGEVYQRKTVEL